MPTVIFAFDVPEVIFSEMKIGKYHEVMVDACLEHELLKLCLQSSDAQLIRNAKTKAEAESILSPFSKTEM